VVIEHLFRTSTAMGGPRGDGMAEKASAEACCMIRGNTEVESGRWGPSTATVRQGVRPRQEKEMLGLQSEA
jgi:hypothetical protein